jgi:hypothetical protein
MSYFGSALPAGVTAVLFLLVTLASGEDSYSADEVSPTYTGLKALVINPTVYQKKKPTYASPDLTSSVDETGQSVFSSASGYQITKLPDNYGNGSDYERYPEKVTSQSSGTYTPKASVRMNYQDHVSSGAYDGGQQRPPYMMLIKSVNFPSLQENYGPSSQNLYEEKTQYTVNRVSAQPWPQPKPAYPKTNVGQYNSPTNVGQYSPPTNVGQYSPPISVGQYSPKTSVGQYSPPISVGQYSPPISVGQYSPKTSVDQYNKQQQYTVSAEGTLIPVEDEYDTSTYKPIEREQPKTGYSMTSQYKKPKQYEISALGSLVEA